MREKGACGACGPLPASAAEGGMWPFPASAVEGGMWAFPASAAEGSMWPLSRDAGEGGRRPGEGLYRLPAPAARAGAPRRIEHALHGEAVLERRGGGKGRGAAV